MNNPRNQFHVRLSEYPKLEKLYHTDAEFHASVQQFMYAVDEAWFKSINMTNERAYVDALINGFFAGRVKE